MMSETVFFFKNFFFCPSRNSCHDENSALYLLWCQSSFQLTVGISVQKGSPLHTRAMGAIGVPSLTYLPAAGFDTSIFLFPISWQKMSHVYSENYICLDFFFFLIQWNRILEKDWSQSWCNSEADSVKEQIRDLKQAQRKSLIIELAANPWNSLFPDTDVRYCKG